MQGSPKPSRRWFQFRLRTLLLVVILFCAWLGWLTEQVRERNAMISTIERHGGSVYYEDEHVEFTGGGDEGYGQVGGPRYQRPKSLLERLRELWGDKPVEDIHLGESPDSDQLDLKAIESLFPEAKIYRP